MSYLLYVALFGAAAVFFLWLRDARIFYRTGLPGYRKAAYQGVIWSAVTLFGFLLALNTPTLEVVGIGIIMLALFLQERGEREKIWSNESAFEKLLGSARKKDR